MATKPELPVNDPMLDPKTGEYAVIAPGHTFKSVTEEVSRIVLTGPYARWDGTSALWSRAASSSCC